MKISVCIRRWCFILCRCVPYEAKGTLKINTLITSQSVQLPALESQQSVRASHSSPVISTSIALPPAPRSCAATIPAPTYTSVSTQTTETMFALCMRCSATQSTLISTATKLVEFCHSLELASQTSEINWSSEVERGSLDPARWGREVQKDFENIKNHCKILTDEAECLKRKLNQRKEMEEDLHLKLSQLIAEKKSLQQIVAESKERHMQELFICRESAAGKMKEIREVQTLIERKNSNLKEELNLVKQEKAKLRALLATISESLATTQHAIIYNVHVPFHFLLQVVSNPVCNLS